ncbi:MAG: ParB N-terminal domain-containing protein [Bryobacterales bacterium]|nr:ParB N-terminal domain-containing protein [Bryobacterales bacterium]
MSSMATAGVIEGDPIIARTSGQAGIYYVIEGNRRLAALKLLNGETLGNGANGTYYSGN